MNAGKILFATDFSDATRGALGVAASMAQALGAELLIVHVEVPFTVDGEELPPAIQQAERKRLEDQLAKIVPPSSEIPVRRVLLTGAPADRIVDFAREEQVDMIVMGTHGRRGVRRFLMGSIAEAVVRLAPCPVLTVKPSTEGALTALLAEAA